MLKTIVTWLLLSGGVGGGIVGILGILMGVNGAFHAIDGRPYDRFFGYSEQDGIGLIYTIVLSCGVFGLLYGLGFSLAGSSHDMFSDLQSSGFVYGGLLGVVHLLSVVGLHTFINGGDKLEESAGNLILNGIVSALFCALLGCFAGIMLGMNDPALLLVRDEAERTRLAGQNAWGTAILLSGVGTAIGVCLGAIGSVAVGLVPPLAKRVHDLSVPFAVSLLARLRYKPLLCHTCFQYSQPERSPYKNGNRFCEHCHHQIPRTAETPGRLFVTFGTFQVKRRRRLYILADPDLRQHDVKIEISALGINTKDCDTQLLKHFLYYITQYPPTKGLRSVGVLYKGELDELGEKLKQALQNTFGSVKSVAQASRK